MNLTGKVLLGLAFEGDTIIECNNIANLDMETGCTDVYKELYGNK